MPLHGTPKKWPPRTYPDSLRMYDSCVMLEYLFKISSAIEQNEINNWLSWAKSINPSWVSLLKDVVRHTELKKFLMLLIEKDVTKDITAECESLLNDLEDFED